MERSIIWLNCNTLYVLWVAELSYRVDMFDEDLQQVQKISLRINTGNIIGPRYKIRLLRIRFTPLERPDRSEVTGVTSCVHSPVLCRFDIIMEENMEVAFRPLPCESRL
ncbi:hypothetical protein GOODEAATRI_009877 [Goodea atripinnis]|uniref:Uncharacterized protein n=1 Tax=Goodea atripinnis TaxID=208336 RepID=A0ABV0MGI3_9TELE